MRGLVHSVMFMESQDIQRETAAWCMLTQAKRLKEHMVRGYGHQTKMLRIMLNRGGQNGESKSNREENGRNSKTPMTRKEMEMNGEKLQEIENSITGNREDNGKIMIIT